MHLTYAFLIFSALGLTACADIYPPTPTPDYTIRVMPSANGGTALPPRCPSWATDVTDPYDNQPIPQFGCANTRNLAIMVDRPDDLVKGRDLGPANGALSANDMKGYQAGQTRGLIDPGADSSQVAVTTAPSANSAASSSGGGGSSPAAGQ